MFSVAKRISGLVIGFGMALSASPADANVVTFTGIPFESGAPLTWSEDGITAVGNGPFGELGSFQNPNSEHMDDGGTPYPSSMTFSMMTPFNAASFDIIPVGNNYCPNNVCSPFDNVVVQGFLDALLVASDTFWMGNSPNTYVFSNAFTDLTSLKISIVFPPDFDSCHFNDPCTHMNIDNVALTPVPLPAALPLFASGLVGLGWLSRRRRKQAAETLIRLSPPLS